MAGAAGLCWYADSRLYTPLLVASLNEDDGKLDADLGNLFGSMVGAYETVSYTHLTLPTIYSV